MEVIINCKDYLLQKENNEFHYRYKNIDMSEKEITELKKIETAQGVSSFLLVPSSLSFSRELNATYAISKEEIYLFDSLYEFDGNYIMGGAETVLSFSHKAEIIKQLCDAFEHLNQLGIVVKKIDSKSLLYDYELNHLSVDLVNMCSKALDANEYGVTHTGITNSIKSIKKKKLVALRKASNKNSNVLSNNLFLGLLIHKILFNQPWFVDTPLQEIFRMLPGITSNDAPQIFSQRLFEDIITKDVYCDFLSALQGKEIQGALNRSPNEYLNLLHARKCVCTSGYTHLVKGERYCDACEGTQSGTITFKNTSKSIPLVFPQRYDLAQHFTIKKETIMMQAARKDEVFALFIPIKGTKIQVFDEGNEPIPIEMNSKEDHYKIIFDPNIKFVRTVDINEKYQFVFSSLSST